MRPKTCQQIWEVRSRRMPCLTRSMPSSRRPMCTSTRPFIHSVSVPRRMISTRKKNQENRCTAMLRKFLEDLISGFEPLLELAGLVEGQELLEEARLFGGKDAFCGD